MEVEQQKKREKNRGKRDRGEGQGAMGSERLTDGVAVGGRRRWPGGFFSSCADNRVGDLGAARLVETLQQNSAPTSLNLSGTYPRRWSNKQKRIEAREQIEEVGGRKRWGGRG